MTSAVAPEGHNLHRRLSDGESGTKALKKLDEAKASKVDRNHSIVGKGATMILS